jgi:hypothetical protein
MHKRTLGISGSVALAAILTLGCVDTPSTAPDISPRFDRPVSSFDVTVTDVEPDSAVRNTTLDVRIQGSGFDSGSEVRWLLGGVPTDGIVTNSTTYVNSQVIVANITISAEADPALYDVEVTSGKGGKPGIGTETFEVLVEQESLPTLSGGTGVAFAINDESVIVGAATDRRSDRGTDYYWQNPAPRYPVKWTRNGGRWTITRLATSASQFAAAYAINDAGLIAGSVYGRATLWLPQGGTVDLGPGCATGVNSSGTVIGMLMTPAGQQGVVWTRGAAGWNAPQFLDESLIPKSWGAWPMCEFITVSAINDTGIIVGTSPYNEPAKWVPQAPGGPWSSIIYFAQNVFNGAAYGINDRGDIIGTGNGVIPRIWLASGEEIDLAPYGTQSGFGTGINDSEIPDVVARAMDMNLPFATVAGLTPDLPLGKRRMRPVSRRRAWGTTRENGAFDINNATSEHPMRIVGAVEDKPMVWTIR